MGTIDILTIPISYTKMYNYMKLRKLQNTFTNIIIIKNIKLIQLLFYSKIKFINCS